jgi:UDP-N-acetylglucosamine diphosphorylase / glucose-1-phosphate thymidylyltransferase / UDP-N-acetylgalactosamine diphosphorylase / glucosamine-1-phosphate N-acetyltransferase / galactosamine-1-phosphate N-acetyltransferase
MDKFPSSYFFDLSTFQHKHLFDDCSQVWEVLTKIDAYLKKYSLGKIETQIPAGAHLINRELISIGKNTVVEPGAYIKGPCIVGEGCSIRHGAYIRGGLIAGNRCVIGHDTEVKNGIFLDGAQAAHFAYVGDTILGNRVNLGAGTVCANLRLDHHPIVLHIDDQRIETNLRKFGAIIGDDSQTGCNSVTNPGTMLGKNVRCYPCTNFGGFVASGQIVRSETKVVLTEASHGGR